MEKGNRKFPEITGVKMYWKSRGSTLKNRYSLSFALQPDPNIVIFGNKILQIRPNLNKRNKLSR